MMTRMIVASVCAAALATAPAALGAQSMSTMTNAKRVASNAAASTNAHTAEMEGGAAASSDKKPVAATKPAAEPSKAAPAAAAAPKAPAPKSEVVIVREEFTYSSEGRRDPFLSLMKTGELRPMISDLRLVTVIFDPVGRSVAIMRDVSTKEQYRVKVGQTLGRMRVTQIRPREVVFTLEEYGFSRQEVLALNDSTRARSQ